MSRALSLLMGKKLDVVLAAPTLNVLPFGVGYVEWTSNNPPMATDGFYLYRRPQHTGVPALIASLPNSSPAFVNVITPGTDETHDLYMRAYQGSTLSDLSNIIVRRGPPVASSSLGFTRTGDLTYTLNWTINSGFAPDTRIYRSTNGGAFTLFQTVSNPTSTYNGTWSSLPSSAQFYVVAYDAVSGLESSASNTVTADVTPPASPPAAPSSLSFNRTGTLTYSLSWSDNATESVTFNVYRSTNGGAFTFLTNVSPTSYNGSWVSLPSSAQFRVTAVSTATSLESSASNTVTADVSPPPDPPAAPTLNFASWFGGEVYIQWTHNASPITSTRIYESTEGPSSGFSLVHTVTGTGTTYYYTQATPGYWYRVTSVNDNGESAPSSSMQSAG